MGRGKIGYDVKQCSACGNIKPLSDFYKDMRYSQGVKGMCKTCYYSREKNRPKKHYLPEIEGTRTCKTCNIEKPITQFKANPKCKQGRIHMCNECEARQLRKYYKEKRSERLETRHEWLEKGGDKRMCKVAKQYRENHPERSHAHDIVHNAVMAGKLTRPNTCSTSDENCRGRIEAHHEDYSKPFEIIWLCNYHHQKLHRRYK